MQSSASYASGKFQNTFQTLIILATMVSLFSLLGWMIFGAFGIFWAVMIAVFILVSTPKLSPMLVLRMYNAKALYREDAGGLYEIVSELSRRADLRHTPRLYYVPSRIMNAFSVGSKNNAAIALSDRLIRVLNTRELAGVLAHEISHIKSNDLRLHALADMMTRVTSMLSFFGQILIIFYLPMIFFTDARPPLSFILILIFAPLISIILQLALSRTREFDADLTAVRLTGDPRGLASALQKMESYDRSIWNILVAPGERDSQPSILRTHPHTQKRIGRLMHMAEAKDRDIIEARERIILPHYFSEVLRPPRRRLFGPWR